MSVYSIRDLEQLSGIKAHTLRIWEQRYSFIEPKRTDTNIRYYDDDDLKFVLNVSLLKDNGHKISKICQMQDLEIQGEVNRIIENRLRFPEQIHALTLAMIDVDEERFEKTISTNILQFGFERTMMEIIYPFFVKIGILWQTGSVQPAQEHFVTHLIRQKIIVAIDGQVNTSNPNAKTFMLYLPEGELHEISLLFSSFLIKSRNHKVIYLGQSLPLSDANEIYTSVNPDYVLSVFTSEPAGKKVQRYVYEIAETFNNSKILLSGRLVVAQGIDCPSNVHIINKLQDLISLIEEA